MASDARRPRLQRGGRRPYRDCGRIDLQTYQAVIDKLVHVGGNEPTEGNLTLLYSARDREHNNAMALKVYLEERLVSKS